MFQFLFSFILLASLSAFAQNAVEELSKTTEAQTPNTPSDLFTETITTISPSKKVFILTNKTGQLGKGDFISLVLDQSLVCRAVVAKTTDKPEAGIKIIKIYSLKGWNKLKETKDVQVIRGDDSFYSKPKEVATTEKKEEEKTLIASEDDLYNESVLLNDGDFEENSKRIIKPDNVFGISFGQIQGYDAEGANQNYPHFMANWAYQFKDNIWAEAVFGQTTISDFPDAGKSTKVTNMIIRFKYTFAAPFYSYILPYLGYQYQGVNSPDAGTNIADQGATPDELDEETRLVGKTKRSQIAAGATILKRLVPGWFIKVNLGIDMIDAGVALEF
ncbi:MAG: hypothetical protein ACOYL6_03980 [Bacteriovoracaceae bacterium]